jgi:hypothetical protein
MKKYSNLMIGLETLGTGVDSVILSIAAVEFCLQTGKTGRCFYREIDLESSMGWGFKIDADTLKWWINQGDEAKKIFGDTGKVEVYTALAAFRDFSVNHEFFWGNSARFDLGILNWAVERMSIDVWWDFRNERDLRTLVGLMPHIKEAHIFDGVKHNALVDCLNQVKYCSETWKAIFKKEVSDECV